MIIDVHILLRQWLGDNTLSIAVCGVQQEDQTLKCFKQPRAAKSTEVRESQTAPRDRIEYRAYICISTLIQLDRKQDRSGSSVAQIRNY